MRLERRQRIFPFDLRKHFLQAFLATFSVCCLATQQEMIPWENIVGHWVHFHEEDEQGHEIYLPANFDFPPSRGRVGFEFKSDGELIYYFIAPADGLSKAEGKWQPVDKNNIAIKFKDPKLPPIQLEILSLKDRRLKLRRHLAPKSHK